MQPRPYQHPHTHFLYGGDYNPEQWPEQIWHDDVRLMREAGVNIVSLGIFSWAQLEPQPGQYRFEWLDRIMDLLHANGIRVDLASATASPPPWLARLHPESLPVLADGSRLWPGSRQQYCPHSPAYRDAAMALLQQIIQRYAAHPALAMWHSNNEYACHVAECFCDTSAAAFRVWLQRCYGTIDALNEAWGTAFWSQRYDSWEDICPPRQAPTFINPTHHLDWRRFSSDSMLELFEQEYALIKQATPDLPITTNFMHLFKPLDYWKWAAREDLVSYDSYPDPADPRAPIDAAIDYDMMRSIGGGKPWLLMEYASAHVNWRPQNPLKRPGQMRLGAYQAVARGANGVQFFQWRAAKAGAEKFHSAMVPHSGTENTRVWREVVALGHELRQLDAVLPSTVRAEVAIMFDWESWWALELDSKPTNAISMQEQLRAYYAPLFARNITADFVAPGADLSGYRLVLVPNLYLVRGEHAQQLEAYVAAGGTLVMSFFSGIVDENEHIWLGGYPAPFRRMLGLRVEEFDAYAPDTRNQIRFADGTSYTCDLWSDVIDLEGAQALASYERDFYAQRPAITRNQFQRGAAYYIGTRPAPEALARVLALACGDAGLAPQPQLPPGVELVRRSAGASAFLFALNHNPHAVELALDGHLADLLSGQQIDGRLALEPYGVAILQAAEG